MKDPLDSLYPPFAECVRKLLSAAKAKNDTYVITQGMRTHAEQDRLYAQGRTAPGSKVTNARGGQSLHQFGVAADLCFDSSDKPGLQPDWSHKRYAPIGDYADGAGLEWGGRWSSLKDLPHVQLPLGKYGLTHKDLQAAYAKGGLDEVWRLLDRYEW